MILELPKMLAINILLAIERHAANVGLFLNAKKTEVIIIDNQGKNHSDIKASDGSTIKRVDDFKYLGSWLVNTKIEIESRIAQTWSTATKLRRIWRSHIRPNLKKNFLNSCVISILLYGCETWTLTKTLERKLDGTYTKLLRYIHDFPHDAHIANKDLYDDSPYISDIIKHRRIRFAGHCLRAQNQPVQKLVLLNPGYKNLKQGQGNKLTYHKLLLTNLNQIGFNNIEFYTEQQITELAYDKKDWNKKNLKPIYNERSLKKQDTEIN